ncbi:Uncharacterised protein [Chlamydia trachomatis]|nr:Uncharacterised protein [Chlamydia trachomatis]
MLLQKLLSFCQSFIIRLLGCSSLRILIRIRNKLAALFLHEVRIRRIAVCIRSLRAFCRRRTLCRAMLLYAFHKLGGVGLVCVKSRTLLVQDLKCIIDFLLRCSRILEQVLCGIKSVTILIYSLFSCIILGFVGSRAIFLFVVRMRRVLKRWAWMRGCVLVNRLNQVIGLGCKLIQTFNSIIKLFKKPRHIPIQRLLLSVRLNAIKIARTICVATLFRNNGLWDFVTVVTPVLIHLIIERLLQLLKRIVVRFLCLSFVRIRVSICGRIFIRRTISNSQAMKQRSRNLAGVGCILIDYLTRFDKLILNHINLFLIYGTPRLL